MAVQAKSATSAPRQVKFDPALAEAVAERLARGLHPSLIAMQLADMADPALVQAYVREAEKNPFFRGATAQTDALKKRDWILEAQRKAWDAQPDPRAIERADRLSPDDFRKHYYANQRPVIISGLVDDWPARTLWIPDYLEQTIGAATMVEAQTGRDTLSNFEEEMHRLTRQVPFSEVARALRAGTPSNDLYITANNGAGNRDAFDPIWTDFAPIPGYIKPDQPTDAFLWIGPAGTITPFHHDLTNNLLVQVRGRKRIHLIPNWEEARMKTRRVWFSDWTPDALQAAGDKAPLVMDFVLEPGEAVFMPVGWWHHVESLDESASVLFTSFVWPNAFSNAFTDAQKG
ncbi:MAG: cupin-like domain-containing protein [Pseudomonadota bacterium]